MEEVSNNEITMTTFRDIAFGWLFDYGTPTDPGTEGSVYFDDDYLYIWVSDEWKKVELELT